MDRKTCRACESSELELLMDLGPQPLAGGFLPPEASAVEKELLFPLPIHVCHKCGLVQTMHVIPAEVLFKQYCFSSSTIQPLTDHFGKYAQWLKDKYSPRLVVEFGCNDGILLSPLGDLGIKACGVDISENITNLARAKGLNVFTGFFDSSMVEVIVSEFGHADVVTGSNAFPHNDNPGVILEAARNILNPRGHLCLEVMYAGDLLQGLQWDSMYHEHLSYFCLQTLETLLNRYGFHTVDAELLPMHAGSLRIAAALDPDEKASPSVGEILSRERKMELTKVETWRQFSCSVTRKIETVTQVMGTLSRDNRIWGYGAAGRSTMWVNACKMNYLEAMVDSSPLRAGRLMPGTHTPIVFPEALRQSSPDYIFVTAWNYLDVIRNKEKWYEGIWSVPLPNLSFF